MRLYRAEATPGFAEKLVLWKPDDELRALDLRGHESRNESVLRLVAQAEEAHGLPQFPPTLVHTGDRPINDGDPGWRSLSFSAADGHLDLPVPDFLFDRWRETGIPDYEEAREQIAAAGAGPPERAAAGWIGATNTHPSRQVLLELGRQRPDLLDVEDISWVPAAGAAPMATAGGNFLSLAQQAARWAVLIDVEGNGWSARFKLLLASGRPVILQDRPWREWWWPLLRPGVHYLPARRDLADLHERVEWALAHPEEAARIGAAGQAFARDHLRRADALRRWAEVFRELARAPELPYAPPAAFPALAEVVRGLA
jgi:hypothetical protein